MTSIRTGLVVSMGFMVALPAVTVASAQQLYMGSAAGYLNLEGNSPYVHVWPRDPRSCLHCLPKARYSSVVNMYRAS